MPRTTSVQLKDHFADFVERQTASGRYSSAEEVVEAGLALLEGRVEEDELDRLDFGPAPIRTREALLHALREGEESGYVEDFKFSDLYEEIDRLDRASGKAAQ
ncbi:type II toxin-antitoxin system ParD family antitoxin [Aureimonas leprariae]|uniref:Type II toxin-antitoxin system ParD family antitoxin n=1 Tax=Plantimonas leprariae TaxID=2615207 RepID=A0A7V7PR71_9HYPH|nr:type II toxin-antitoxin system ParD family antitoxin [Aureimonas leprariae]KAB0681198.1 type II toxin-antitoxin system ParD family antitoxin [Aureimonas leprariae]